MTFCFSYAPIEAAQHLLQKKLLCPFNEMSFAHFDSESLWVNFDHLFPQLSFQAVLCPVSSALIVLRWNKNDFNPPFANMHCLCHSLRLQPNCAFPVDLQILSHSYTTKSFLDALASLDLTLVSD